MGHQPFIQKKYSIFVCIMLFLFLIGGLLCQVNTSWAGPVSDSAPAAVSDSDLGMDAPSARTFVKEKQYKDAPSVSSLYVYEARGVGQDPRIYPFSALNGRWSFIHVWATWCAPCVIEMPGLDRFSASLSEKDPAFLMVSINKGMRSDQMDHLWRKWGMRSATPYYDPRQTLSTVMDVSVLPATFVVDPAGRLHRAFYGPYDWTAEKMRSIIREIEGQRVLISVPLYPSVQNVTRAEFTQSVKVNTRMVQ